MLTSLAFWSLTDIELRCHGDLWVDEHHTVEDCALALGEAFDIALGDRTGVRRFGFSRAPLDEALAEATVDLSGRGIAELDLALGAPAIGRMPSSLVPHFFDSFARRGRLGLHLTARGEDAHHVAEAAFKALALALREAVEPDPAAAAASPAPRACCDRHVRRLRRGQPALAARRVRAHRRGGRRDRPARGGRRRRRSS